MYTLTVNSAITGDGAGINSKASVQTPGADKNEVILAPNSVNVEIDMAIDISTVKGLVLLATADTTLKTNSTSAPDDTINLFAGRDNTFIDGQGEVQFGTDVTKIYASSLNGGTLTIWNFYDSTPSQ